VRAQIASHRWHMLANGIAEMAPATQARLGMLDEARLNQHSPGFSPPAPTNGSFALTGSLSSLAGWRPRPLQLASRRRGTWLPAARCLLPGVRTRRRHVLASGLAHLASSALGLSGRAALLPRGRGGARLQLKKNPDRLIFPFLLADVGASGRGGAASYVLLHHKRLHGASRWTQSSTLLRRAHIARGNRPIAVIEIGTGKGLSPSELRVLGYADEPHLAEIARRSMSFASTQSHSKSATSMPKLRCS